MNSIINAAMQKREQVISELIAKIVDSSRHIRSYADEIRFMQQTLDMIEHHELLFSYLPEQFRRNKVLALAAVKQDAVNLKYLPSELYSDRDITICAAQHHANSITHMHRDFVSDYDVVKLALKHDMNMVEFLPQTTASLAKNDKELILHTVYNSARNFLYADKSLHLDLPFLLECLKVNEKTSRYFPKVIVQAAQTNDPEVLRHYLELAMLKEQLNNRLEDKHETLKIGKSKL